MENSKPRLRIPSKSFLCCFRVELNRLGFLHLGNKFNFTVAGKWGALALAAEGNCDGDPAAFLTNYLEFKMFCKL